jgi:hypothetical protein
MRVRVIQQMSGIRGDGSSWPAAGEEFEVGDAEGADLCRVGIAVPVAEERAVEVAEPVSAPVEVREEPPAAPALEPAPEPESPLIPVKRGPGRPPKNA